MMVRYVDGNNISRMVRGQQQQGNSAPIGYSSVSDGSLRILSPQGFYVGGDASAVVDGLLRVLGVLDLSGTFVLSGTGSVTGAFTVTGPFTVEGNTSMTGNFMSTGEFTLTGPFHINGPTDLNGSLLVRAGGSISVEGAGNLTIGVHPVTGRASIRFAGGDLSSDNDQIALTNGSGFIGTGNGSSIVGLGAHAFVARGDGLYLLGVGQKPASGGGGGGTDPGQPV